MAVMVLEATDRSWRVCHPSSPLWHGSPASSHAMRPSDPAALHVQLQQDAGGDVAVAEAEAGAEQKLMLSSMASREAVVCPFKEDSNISASSLWAVLSTGKALQHLDHEAPAASICCSVGAETPDSGTQQLLLTGMEFGKQARCIATI